MSPLTSFQWRRQFFRILRTTAALWGLRVPCASVRPMPAVAEQAEPLQMSHSPAIDRRWQPAASIFQLTRS